MTGATGGLGRAIAKALHARGATVLLSGRRTEELRALSEELDDRVEVVPADLANHHEVNGLPGRVEPLDILVANAGLPGSGKLDSFSAEQIDRALDVNLRAPMQLARAFAPEMVRRGYGHLVFVSSTSGKVATAGSSIYSATKFGLRGFAFGAREDLRGTGVGVTTIFPGFIRDAGMFADSGVKLPPGIGTRTPGDVAAAVLKGIDEDVAEIDVASLPLKIGAVLSGISPSLMATLTRSSANKTASGLASSQRNQR